MTDRLRLEAEPAHVEAVISLRDWLAGQALTTLIATDPDGTPEQLARAAYRQADAMLAVRGGR